MHPGPPRGASPPRPTSSGSHAAAAAAAALQAGAGNGGNGGRRGLKSPRLYREACPSQEQEEEEEDDDDEEVESEDASGGQWGGGAFDDDDAFDHAHPLYRRWDAPSATAAVLATPDLLAVVLACLAPSSSSTSAAAASYRWPTPTDTDTAAATAAMLLPLPPSSPDDAAAAAVVAVVEEEEGEAAPSDETGPRAACQALGTFSLVARLWCVAACVCGVGWLFLGVVRPLVARLWCVRPCFFCCLLCLGGGGVGCACSLPSITRASISIHPPLHPHTTTPRLSAARRPCFWRPIAATRLPVLALQLQEQETAAESAAVAGAMAGPFLPPPLAAAATSSMTVEHQQQEGQGHGGGRRRRPRWWGEEEEEGGGSSSGSSSLPLGHNGGDSSSSGNVYFAALRAYGQAVVRRQLLLEGALPRYGDLILGCVREWVCVVYRLGRVGGGWIGCDVSIGSVRVGCGISIMVSFDHNHNNNNNNHTHQPHPPTTLTTMTTAPPLRRFEVWDASDGLRMLSASGPFCVVPIEGITYREGAACVGVGVCVWLSGCVYFLKYEIISTPITHTHT